MSSDCVYYSVLGGEVSHEIMERASIAAIEYKMYALLGTDLRVLREVSDYVYRHAGVRPVCIEYSRSALPDAVGHFLFRCISGHCYFRLELETGSLLPVVQLKENEFYVGADGLAGYSGSLMALDPILRHAVRSSCAEINELTSLVYTLLNGKSFLADEKLLAKYHDSDLAGLRLAEFGAFVDQLRCVSGSLEHISTHVTEVLTYCSSLLASSPASASDLQGGGTCIQDGFPCVYKIMSIMHYLGFELSMERGLYNKAFMHLFRSLECYASGVLFLRNAEIGDKSTKSGVKKDCFLLDGKTVSGFGAVIDGVGTQFGVGGNKHYQVCKFYVGLRNRFHYTHGDLKPSLGLTREFAHSVIRLILKLECVAQQRRFKWRVIFKGLKSALMPDRVQIVQRAVEHKVGVEFRRIGERGLHH